MIRITPDEHAYSMVHWKGVDGSNQFLSYGLDGGNTTQVHTYSMLWLRCDTV